MASSEVQAFDVTIPAGTAQAAPQTTAIATGIRILNGVFITFPDGCGGLVGIRLTMGGVPVVPRNDGAWIKGNGRVVPYQLEGYPDSGAWQLTGYNTDIFDHTISIEMLLSQPGAQPPPPGLAAVVTVDAAQLAPVPDIAAILPPLPEAPPAESLPAEPPAPPAPPPPPPASPAPAAPVTFTGAPIIATPKGRQ